MRVIPARASARRDVCKDQVERPRHVGEVERLDEQTRIPDLPAGAAAHEAPQLLLSGPSLPRRLLLERAEGAEITLSVDDLLDGGRAVSADQLVLEVGLADVEAQPLQVGASEVGAEAGALEAAPEVAFLRGVTETRELEVASLRAVETQEPSDGLGAADRHNGNALGLEIATAALGERLQGLLVARPFDEHDRT